MKTTVNERILILIKSLKMNKNSFGNATGIQPQTLHHIVGGRLGKPSYEVIEKILETFPDISSEWLIMGEGEMNKSKVVLQNVGNIDSEREWIKRLDELIQIIHRQSMALEKLGKTEVSGYPTCQVLDFVPKYFEQMTA